MSLILPETTVEVNSDTSHVVQKSITKFNKVVYFVQQLEVHFISEVQNTQYKVHLV